MRTTRWLLALALLSVALLGCDDGDGSSGDCDPLTQICEGDVRTLPDQTDEDTALPPQDTASDSSAEDTTEDGAVDSADPGDVDELCGLGGILGRVCAPRGDQWIGGARVVLQGTDCRTGEDFVVETLSEADGGFTFSDVPSGSHTVVLQKGSFQASYEIAVEAGRTIDVTGGLTKTCLIDEGVRIAVVDGFFDNIHLIVSDLGLERDYFSDFGSPSPGEALLLDPTRLATYDILMLNCGEQWDQWAERDAIIENIRGFVLNGGNVYASDWFYPWIEAAFPDAIDFAGDDTLSRDAWQGAQGDVTGTVLDSRLERAIGQQQVTIHYPLLGWTVVEAVGEGTESLISGTVPLRETFGGGEISEAPLLVTFQPEAGAGRVYYTTFHNEEQLDAEIERVLKHVILSL